MNREDLLDSLGQSLVDLLEQVAKNAALEVLVRTGAVAADADDLELTETSRRQLRNTLFASLREFLR